MVMEQEKYPDAMRSCTEKTLRKYLSGFTNLISYLFLSIDNLRTRADDPTNPVSIEMVNKFKTNPYRIYPGT